MAKKLKKVRKGISPKAKFTLFSAFKGLFSNQSVIDGSRNSAWWVAAIFFVFSVILPLLPTFAKLSDMNGASFIATYNYGLDEQLAHFAYTQKKDGVEFKVENGKLASYKNEEPKDLFVEPDEAYFGTRECEYYYVNKTNNQIEFKVYFWKDKNLAKNVKEILKQTYRLNSQDPATGEKNEKLYLPNILILTPTTMSVGLYKANTKTAVAASYAGLDWLNSTPKKGIIERLLADGVDEAKSLTEDGFVNTYRASTLKAFKGICTETYLNQKTKTKWSNTGIYAGIYAGAIVFLGLMVFILTRGRSNPYKFLNVWECQKISWWAAASPAIIGTLLSLIFSGNAIGQMAFILVCSLRVMWLSMKQLRPVYNQ